MSAPRRDRRDRHRGADGQGQRPQRAVAGRAAARAGRRSRATRRSSATAPRTCARRSTFMAEQGMDLIAHQRRARADRRRPHGRGRRRVPGPRDGARRGARRADRADRGAADETLAEHRPRGDRRGQPQAGDDPARRDRARAGRDGAGAGRAAARAAPHAGAGRPSSCCPARRASCSRCGRRRSRPTRCARRSQARPSTASARCACSGSPSRRSPRRCASPNARGSSSARLEVTTCLKRGEVEIVTRYEPDAQDAYDAFARGRRAAPRRHAVLARRQHRRRAGRGAAERRSQPPSDQARARRARSPPPSRAPAACWRRA